MQVGDHVIVKLGFWTGPSQARAKAVYEVTKITDRKELNMVHELELRGPDGAVKEGEPQNHYEVVRGPSRP